MLVSLFRYKMMAWNRNCCFIVSHLFLYCSDRKALCTKQII